jgi:hypothetical protein
VKTPLRPGGVVGRGGVGEAAVTNDVVGDDQPAGADVVEGPGEVVGGVDLVGVDEDEVEGRLPLQRRQRLQGRSDPDLDPLPHSRPLDAPAGDLRVLRLRLERDQPPIPGQRPRHQDRAVAAQRPELENLLRTGQPGQQLQQPALRRRDLNRRQPGLLGSFHRPPQRLVLLNDRLADEGVDGREGPLVHLLGFVPGGEDPRAVGGHRDGELEVGGK